MGSKETYSREESQEEAQEGRGVSSTLGLELK